MAIIIIIVIVNLSIGTWQINSISFHEEGAPGDVTLVLPLSAYSHLLLLIHSMNTLFVARQFS